ncbi:MAG: hypothetical protein NVSMB27_47260 [Ktedonobacteraceae bacterium]
MGFQATYRSGYWTPVHVTLSNTGADFSGVLSLSTFSGPPHSTTIGILSPWSFQQPVTLPKGAQKQVTVNVPFYLGNYVVRGVVANLRDYRGRVVTTQTSTSGYEVKPGNIFIGVLADAIANFDALNTVSLPNQTSSPTLSTVDATTMPVLATVLDNFDVIVLDDFSSSTLNSAQLAALQTWVNRGGILIEVGGPAWLRTLGTLPPEMVPVAINGITTLPAETHLLPISSSIALQSSGQKPPPDTLAQPVVASTARLRPQTSFFDSETVLAAGTIPLIVQAHQGQGVISYLAVDPASPPLAGWSNLNALWKTVLVQAFGDRLLIPNTGPIFNSGPGRLLTRGGVISVITPEALLGPWILAVLLLGYLIVLGPLRLLLVRRLKLPQRGWPIILSSIVVFSLLAYGLAFYQRGASLKDNSISLIQMNQGGTSAHITTYLGMYVPNQGDFTLHIPGESLAQPIDNQFLFSLAPAKGATTFLPNDDVSASVISGTGGTDLKLMGLGPWTFHPVVLEQDRQLQGSLVAHLSLHNHSLTGTIANTLTTSLSDVYVLLSHSYVRIGNLSPGETRQVDLPLSVATQPPGKTLADQIAESGGLPAAYFPYASNAQPQTDFERHMALLSALNGAGFSFPPCGKSCNAHSITSGDTIYVTGGKVPNPGVIHTPDPLLETDTPATLIGWADRDVAGVDNLTINSTSPTGRHDSFIQMPLSIDVSDPLKLPSDFIAGRVIDIQSFDAQAILPGIYSMTTGGLTFEFTLPGTTNLQVHGLTITEPDLLAGASGPSTNVSHLQANLYNWQKGTWDAITLQKDTFTTSDAQAYIGPGGRALLQISNQNASLGKLFFSRPSLSLHGG